MRSCRQVSRLISEGLDRRLPWTTRLAVRLHALMCGPCGTYRRQLHRLHRKLHGTSHGGRTVPGETGPELGAAAKDRIKTAVRQNGPSRGE